MSVLNSILTGDKLPEVEFKVIVDDHSIIKVGVMIVAAAAIIILIATVLKVKK